MIRLQIIDLFKGTNVNYWYKNFNILSNQKRDFIVNYRNKKLQKLIKHAYKHVSYYKELFETNGIKPNKINDISDLSIIPVLDRSILQKKFRELFSDNINISSLIKGSSSGTTGIPIQYYKCKNGLSAGIAAGYVLWGLSGWKPGDPTVHIWGNAISVNRWKTPQSRVKTKLFNQINIDSTTLDNEYGIQKAYKKIKSFGPKTIDGYSSSIFSLANFIEKNNRSFKKCNQIFTTAENLTDIQREVIERNLGPTSDLYGSGEILGVAVRPVNDNKYYIFEPHVIVEAIESGIKGVKEILLTDLDNYGMPLIRYKIGDLVDDIHEPDNNSKYPFLYFNKIIGRSSDIIRLNNGKSIHPVNLFGGTLFREFNEIVKHKVIWDGMLITFVFEVTKTFDDFKLKKKIESLLREYNVKFKIIYTDKIKPSPSGKYKYLEIINTK